MSNSKPILDVGAPGAWHRCPWEIMMSMRHTGRFYHRERPLTTMAILEIHRGKFRWLTVRQLIEYTFKTFDVVPKTDAEFKVTEIALMIFRYTTRGFGAPFPTVGLDIEKLI